MKPTIEETKPYVGDDTRINIKVDGVWFWVPKSILASLERLKLLDAQEPVAWMFSVREKDGSIREFAAIDYYIQPHDLKIISKIPLYTKPEAK